MEILVAGAIGGVMVAGHMKTLQLSLESNLVAKSSLAEADLHYTIGQALQGQDCLANFKTKTQADPNPYAQGLYGDDREWGIGEVFQLKKGGTVVLEKGEDFKRILEIVKMSLKGDPNPKDDSTNITKGATATRQFVVYYKKVGLGGYSTLAGEPCDKDKLQGCYFNQCGVRLKESPGDPVCVKLDCANYGSQGSGGGGNPDCYHVDKTDSASGAKTIVGCGERNTTIAGRITAIGFGAGGKNSSGLGQNVFIGYGAGYENTTAGANTLIGYQAGYSNTVGENNTIIGYSSGLLNTSGANNTIIGKGAGYYNKTSGRNTFIGNNAGFRVTGEKNTFIGDHAGSLVTTGTKNIAIGSSVHIGPFGADSFFSKTDSNQINIGNIIQAKQQDKSDSDTTKIGVLRVCNADGSECLPLSKKSFTCPDKDGAKQFFRGFNDDGTPLCEKERCTPQTGLYFWKPENQCHHCPRASPLYRADASPPDCVPCVSNSRYILASNKCQSICPSYQTNVGGVCTCLHPRPHHWGQRCNKCRQNQVVSNGHCCDRSTPYHHGGRCNPCPQNQVVSNGHCCDHSTPYHHGGRCNKCPQNQVVSNGHCCDHSTPYHHGGRCNECPVVGQVKNNGSCECPSILQTVVGGECKCPDSFRYFYGGNCFQCPEGQGRALSTTSSSLFEYYTPTRCCPIGQPYFYDNGCHKCRKGHVLYRHCSIDGSCSQICSSCPYGQGARAILEHPVVCVACRNNYLTCVFNKACPICGHIIRRY